MPQKRPEFNPSVLDDLFSRIATLERQIRLVNRSPVHVERINPVTLADPVESQIAIDSRSNCLIYYANGAWREKCSAVHAIKVYGDRTVNKVRDGAFKFPVEEDLADTVIEQVQVFNGTSGTGATSIQVRNITRSINILDTIVSVPSGLFISTVQADINDAGPITNPNNMVHDGDMLWINCIAVGTGSKGLGCYITFHGPKVNVEP